MEGVSHREQQGAWSAIDSCVEEWQCNSVEFGQVCRVDLDQL